MFCDLRVCFLETMYVKRLVLSSGAVIRYLPYGKITYNKFASIGLLGFRHRVCERRAKPVSIA